MAEVLEAMKRASQAYGQPHLHAGIGLRRLGKHMECRDALDYRLIFARDGDTLVFVFYGTHKAVQAFVKNRRWLGSSGRFQRLRDGKHHRSS